MVRSLHEALKGVAMTKPFYGRLTDPLNII